MSCSSQIIQLNDTKRWNDAVCSLGSYDVYYLAEYHLAELARTNDSEEACLFVFDDDNGRVVVPFLRRPVSKLYGLEDEEYFDATTVYGYAGALTNVDLTNPEVLRQTQSNFQKKLIEVFNELKIVSFFSRQHPLFPTHTLYEGKGEILQLWQTVAIDLTCSEEEYRRGLSKGAKSDLSKARREEIKVVEDTEFKRLDEFIEIYNRTMSRLNADQMYFFPREYYQKLIEGLTPNRGLRLFFSEYQGKTLSTAMFFFTGDTVQYHLSGSTPEERNHSGAHRYLLDAVRKIAIQEGYKYFHLGGGTGKEDSLFRFKASFSKLYCDFYVVKFNVNPAVSERLAKKRRDRFEGEIFSEFQTSYFPEYRNPFYEKLVSSLAVS